jgi:hypothetical protein
VTVSYFTANLPPEVEAAILRKKDDDDEPKSFKMFGRIVIPQETNKPAEFLSHRPEASTGIVLSVETKSAYATWVGENGLHSFVEGKTTNNVFVHTSDVAAKDYRPPSFLERRGAIHPTNVGAVRRTYQRTESYVEDHLLAARLSWQGNLPAVLAFFAEQQLQRAAGNLIDE